MKSFKFISPLTAAIALLGTAGWASAQSMPPATGYVQDSRGNMVMSGTGQCWHTQAWSPAVATAACDPSFMPKPAPVAVYKPATVLVLVAPAPAPTVTWETLITQKPVRIDGASFDVGSSQLHRGDIAGLDEVVKTATDHSEIHFVVAGYTSSTGGEQMNQRLSQDRASSVKRYMVSKGVDALRITTKGFGEASPIADNNTVQGREDNRRVEIRYTVTEETRMRLTRR